MARHQTAASPEAVQLRREAGFYSDPELAALYGITLLTLRNRRCAGTLPPSSKVGRYHLTSIKDALAYIARRKRAA